MDWLIRANKPISSNLTMANNRELVKVFKAIGNERRFLILKHLFSKKELTVGEISKLINLSFKSVSRHLAILYSASLIDVRKVNLNHIYFIDNEAAKEFIKFLRN